jgi:arginine:pyruvate transaminase
MKERTIVIMSMSKSHVMTGWRMGWIIAEPDMIHNFMQHNLVNSYGISDFISRAATEALNNAYGVGELSDLFTRRGATFRETLAGTNGVSILNEDGAMYFMIDIRNITMDAEKFAFELLEKEKLCVMPGDSFGPSAAGHLRISLCQPEEKLRDGANRLKRFVSSYSS